MNECLWDLSINAQLFTLTEKSDFLLYIERLTVETAQAKNMKVEVRCPVRRWQPLSNILFVAAENKAKSNIFKYMFVEMHSLSVCSKRMLSKLCSSKENNDRTARWLVLLK